MEMVNRTELDLVKKKIKLMATWNSMTVQKREWWVRSLPLEQRAMMNELLSNNKNKLF